MPLTNSSESYGSFTKLFHWLIVALFAWQYISGNIMLEMERGSIVLGLNQNGYFNWHKSIGLVALAIAIFRIINRSVGQLPEWAPTLGSGEKVFIHRAEQVLYLVMFVMPISGYLYVMAGGFGVLLFGEWRLPNPIGKVEWLAFIAKWVHIVAGWVLATAVAGHVLLVLRHQLLMRDGLLWRMLPGRPPEA
ncbi:MAG: cytochrome b [Pseudomonadota bacterium]